MANIKAKNVTFKYPDSNATILDNLSFELPTGAWTAIIGHNGSGKSTLARLIDGLLIPNKGSIEVDGLKVNEESLGIIHQKIGFVFQNPENQFVGATVADDVAFGLENRQVPADEMDEKITAALEMVGMSAYKEVEPVNLSGGQKQRVALAGILALMPRMLILDEATSMLDPLARRDILHLLQELKEQQKLSIISITHDLNEIALADEVMVLDEGRIVKQGTAAEVLMDSALLNRLGLGMPASQQLLSLLAQRGVDVPNHYLNLEELKQWLIQQLR